MLVYRAGFLYPAQVFLDLLHEFRVLKCFEDKIHSSFNISVQGKLTLCETTIVKLIRNFKRKKSRHHLLLEGGIR